MKEGHMTDINGVRILEFSQLGDARGHLVVAEGGEGYSF